MFITLILLQCMTVYANQLLVDKGVRAAGYWCLPYANDPLRFRYLPQDVRLARDGDGRPMFSMVRYINPEREDEAGAGSVLTMVLEYTTSSRKRAAIARALKQIVDPDAVLEGSLIFESGTYSMISSVGEDARVRFHSGQAPVLEGGRVSISMHFERQATMRLWAALQAATPDLSVVFDMTYSGVHSSFNAEVIVDWDKARHSLDEGLSASISVYSVSVGGEIERAVERMRSDGSISVKMIGEDKASEELIATIQERATELFFEPLEIEEEAGDTETAMDRLTGGGAAPMANQYFSLDFSVKYKRKDIASKGTFNMHLNKQGPASRHWTMVFDAGEIAASLRDDPYYVKSVDLRQAMLEQRLDVRIDAGLNSIFADFVDLVTVELRKEHRGTDHVTIDQAVISPGRTGYDQNIQLSYARMEGEECEGWMDYQYRTIWRLKGGLRHTTDWIDSREPEVIVYSPVRTAFFQPLGNLSKLAERGVHAVIIEVRYPFFGTEQMERKSTVTSAATFDSFELTVPVDDVEFRYLITHVYSDRREQFRSSDKAGFIMFDPDIE